MNPDKIEEEQMSTHPDFVNNINSDHYLDQKEDVKFYKEKIDLDSKDLNYNASEKNEDEDVNKESKECNRKSKEKKKTITFNTNKIVFEYPLNEEEGSAK